MLRPTLPAGLSAHSDSARAAETAAASVAQGGAPRDLTEVLHPHYALSCAVANRAAVPP